LDLQHLAVGEAICRVAEVDVLKAFLKNQR